MAKQNYFRSNAVSDIIATIKNNPNIDFEKLIVKLSVNAPFLKETTAREMLRSLIFDEQVSVNTKGEVNIC